MRYIVVILLNIMFCVVKAQPNVVIPTDTSGFDTKAFAFSIVNQVNGNYEKADSLLKWLTTHFNWLATDYKDRTVKQIIVRQGGNCFEMAMVYMALLKELSIKYRPIAEVNIHVRSEDRETSSEEKIKTSGNRMSVFGRQHNDHRWVEIFNDKTQEWIPADPTMGLIGYEQWLKGRAWLGERNTMNPDFNKDMIVPFAVFVMDTKDKYRVVENRSTFYLVNKLDSLYGHRLSKLPSWKEWIKGVQKLSVLAKSAFENSVNLHDYTSDIAKLNEVYLSMKKEYLNSQ